MKREAEIVDIVEYALASGLGLDVLLYVLALSAEAPAVPERTRPEFSTHVYVH